MRKIFNPPTYKSAVNGGLLKQIHLVRGGRRDVWNNNYESHCTSRLLGKLLMKPQSIHASGKLHERLTKHENGRSTSQLWTLPILSPLPNESLSPVFAISPHSKSDYSSRHLFFLSKWRQSFADFRSHPRHGVNKKNVNKASPITQ